MEWETIERPGYFGKKKQENISKLNEKYLEGNWRIRWGWGNSIIDFPEACIIYEDGYFCDYFKRKELWIKLSKTAKDIFDYSESDLEAGLDYSKQPKEYTHLQDIAIKRVFARVGLEFKGKELIQIRSHSAYWGKNFSPGKVQFHIPEKIILPHLKSWWDFNSIEDFYQSNKILQVRKR